MTFGDMGVISRWLVVPQSLPLMALLARFLKGCLVRYSGYSRAVLLLSTTATRAEVLLVVCLFLTSGLAVFSVVIEMVLTCTNMNCSESRSLLLIWSHCCSYHCCFSFITLVSLKCLLLHVTIPSKQVCLPDLLINHSLLSSRCLFFNCYTFNRYHLISNTLIFEIMLFFWSLCESQEVPGKAGFLESAEEACISVTTFPHVWLSLSLDKDKGYIVQEN